MNLMRAFVMEKIHGGKMNLSEELVQFQDEQGKAMRVGVNPTIREISSMMDEGVGLRILVGADELSSIVLVWAGDGNSNTGAMHETIGDQFGMIMQGNRHVPLEMTAQGRIAVTTTAQGLEIDGPRDAEDILDRNPAWRKVHQKHLGAGQIDYSRLNDF